MADSNLELVQSGYEAFGRGDIPAVLEILSEDIEWSVPEILPHGMKTRGRDGVGGFFQNLGSTWEGLNVEVDDFVASGDRVVVLGRASGSLNGVQTGYGFVHAWKVADGAAVTFDEYVDPPRDVIT